MDIKNFERGADGARLYKILEMPDNKTLKNEMHIVPVNKSGWYASRKNKEWAGRCCYILEELGTGHVCEIAGYADCWSRFTEPVVRVMICHPMFIFREDYLVFETLRSYLEPCKLSYLLAMQKQKEDEQLSFFNSEKYKRINNLLKQ